MGVETDAAGVATDAWRFTPKMSESERARKYAGWQVALRKALA
jgi:glycerol kinase